MAKTILGFDIGTYAIKGVLVRRGLRAAHLVDAAMATLPPVADEAAIAAALRDLAQELGSKADRCVLVVSAEYAFRRHLQFPFRQERKIAQALIYEMEDTLPVPAEQVLIDFIRCRRLPDGGQEILAAALPKERVMGLVEALEDQGLRSPIVSLDGVGLGLIAAALGDQVPDRLLVLDIGHGKTTLFLRGAGGYLDLRRCSFGCRRLARAAAAILKVNEEEGLQRALALGLAGPRFDARDAAVQEGLRRELQALLRDIELTVAAAPLPAGEAEPEMVVLCGGGSLVGGLGEALEAELGIPVRHLSDFADAGILNPLRETPSTMAQYAVAAAVAAHGDHQKMIFTFYPRERQQRFFDLYRPQLVYGLTAMLLVASSWLGGVWLEVRAKEQRLRRLEQCIEAIFQQAVPDAPRGLVPIQYESVLRGRLQELQRSISLFGGPGGSYLAVEQLRAVSTAISPDLQVEFSLLSLDENRARIAGEAATFNTIEMARNRLLQTGFFSEVKISGAKATAGGKRVRFQLDLVRAPR